MYFSVPDARIDTSSSLFSESTIMPTTYVQILRVYYVTTDSVTSYPVVPPAQVSLLKNTLHLIQSDWINYFNSKCNFCNVSTPSPKYSGKVLG